MRPSRLVAALRMTNGRPSRISVKNGWLSVDRALGRQPDVDRDAVLAQKGEAAAADGRIRILDRGHHARDAGVDDRADARAGPALVAARLERAVQRRAAGARTGLGQRVHLGVRFTGALVEALPDDDAVGRHHDRADQRIRAGPSARRAPRGTARASM